MPALANPKWEKFCQEYAKSGNATQAYHLAGYKPGRSCGPNAARLTANDIIKRRLAELAERVLAAWEVDLKWWTERAKSYASLPDMATTIEEKVAAVKAATPMMELLAKHLGTLKPEQHEISGPGGSPIASEMLHAKAVGSVADVAGMSDVELRSMLTPNPPPTIPPTPSAPSADPTPPTSG